jgi:hypothetical protein
VAQEAKRERETESIGLSRGAGRRRQLREEEQKGTEQGL